jgi:hypothetical protein
MANRLSGQKSPYLLQHRDNPVDWYPWGEEAFAEAQRLDRPIFLSIGYSSCHWCHVMAHESFEDAEVAVLLNGAFVCVKVDREERPDIDSVYMAACQMMTGEGGWPLTMILTPQKEPFYAATYLPRESRFGRLGLMELLPRLTSLWQKDRGKVEEAAVGVVQALRDTGKQIISGEPGIALLEQAYGELAHAFDHELGGFGLAPKFPVPHNLSFLLRWWKRTGNQSALMMVEKTLQAMRRGGIFDQVGFGFHRYSTDPEWKVPHFEKMLYDQALMTLVCLEAYQATRDPQYAGMAEETLDYMQRDLGAPGGGYYTGEDADSGGQEGAYYLWKLEEIDHVLGPQDGSLAARVFGLLPGGNFRPEVGGGGDGLNILHLAQPLAQVAAQIGVEPAVLAASVDNIRQRLFEARQTRLRPQRDDKILCDWNGLALAACARAAQVLGGDHHLARAKKLADFMLGTMRREKGQLYHLYFDGGAAGSGTLDDYAFLVWGLLELYEAGFDEGHLKAALEITEAMIADFWDNSAGGFYFSPANGEKLLVRQKTVYDGAQPSGNSAGLLNLARLARITASPELEEMALHLARVFAGAVAASPAMHTHFLCGLSLLLGPSREIVIAGAAGAGPTMDLLKTVRDIFIPDKVLLFKNTAVKLATLDDLAPFTREMTASDGTAAAYVCEGNRCLAPIAERGELILLLGDAGQPSGKPD